MKKLVLVAACLLSVMAGFSRVSYQKQNGGLFGYKTVDQTTMNNGDTFVNCSDPGRTRCRAQASVTWPNGPVLTAEGFDAIDKTVMGSINESNTKGTFVYNDNFFVVYTYNVDTNTISVDIYSMDEAKKAGLI